MSRLRTERLKITDKSTINNLINCIRAVQMASFYIFFDALLNAAVSIVWLEGCVAHSASLINIFQSNIQSILQSSQFFVYSIEFVRNLKLALTERARCLLFFRSAGKSIFESRRVFTN